MCAEADHQPPSLPQEDALETTDVEVADLESKNDKAAHEEQTNKPSLKSRLIHFYFTYEFLILLVFAIVLAKAYPPLGADYLQPQITAEWIAVILIFVISGAGLKTNEFVKAFRNYKFNLLVEVFNFGVCSSVTFGFSTFMVHVGALSQNLAHGLIISSCLSVSINMVIVLAHSAGGDDAAAVFHAAFGNILGVFLSPLLILGYLGVTGNVNLGGVFYKLGVRVLLPLLFGQVLRLSKAVRVAVVKHKKMLKHAQVYALVYIVYTVFCEVFEDEKVSNLGEIFLMVFIELGLLLFFMVLAWYVLKAIFPRKPKLRITGLFVCTHKNLALGVPLIHAIYGNDPNVGVYTLPILIWYPMQLVVGSILAPRLEKFAEREKERLGSADADSLPSPEDDEEEAAMNNSCAEEEATVQVDSEST